MTFAVAVWIALCVLASIFAVLELHRAEKSYLSRLSLARCDDDVVDAQHELKQSQSFWLGAWSLVCFLSGIAVYLVDWMSK